MIFPTPSPSRFSIRWSWHVVTPPQPFFSWKKVTVTSSRLPLPIGSMYGICGNIYHQYSPNVSIYAIHGSYGFIGWNMPKSGPSSQERIQRSQQIPGWSGIREVQATHPGDDTTWLVVELASPLKNAGLSEWKSVGMMTWPQSIWKTSTKSYSTNGPLSSLI